MIDLFVYRNVCGMLVKKGRKPRSDLLYVCCFCRVIENQAEGYVSDTQGNWNIVPVDKAGYGVYMVLRLVGF